MGHYVYKYVDPNTDEILYIGKNDTNLISRLEQHKEDSYSYADVYYIELSSGTESEALESCLISKYKPRYNKAKLVDMCFEIIEPKWTLFTAEHFKKTQSHKSHYYLKTCYKKYDLGNGDYDDVLIELRKAYYDIANNCLSVICEIKDNCSYYWKPRNKVAIKQIGEIDADRLSSFPPIYGKQYLQRAIYDSEQSELALFFDTSEPEELINNIYDLVAHEYLQLCYLCGSTFRSRNLFREIYKQKGESLSDTIEHIQYYISNTQLNLI